MVVNTGKINQLVVLFPRLFGCRRMDLTNIETHTAMDKLMGIFQEIGAIKVGESFTVCSEIENHYYKVNGKWLVLIFGEYESPKIIARPTILDLFSKRCAT